MARRKKKPEPYPISMMVRTWTHSMEQLCAEIWLAARLVERGIENPNLGTTDLEIRKNNFRRVIIENKLSLTVVGKRKGTPETFNSVFKRIYGEELA